MNDKVMKKTQDTLGKIIDKPPLKEKLLSKPPFRFLHDIMTTVIRTTGFMKGLYQENEMVSDNVKDKESKVAFLQKSLDMVSLVLGKPVPARPSKIVAGHEPEKTNEFLQMLAEAINKKVNNDEYVARVLKNDGSGGGGGGSKKEKPPTGGKERKDRESSADRRKRKDKDEDKKKDEDGERHRSKREDREDKKDRGKSRDRERDKDRHREKDRDRERSKDRGKDGDREKDKERRHRDREKSRDRGEDKDRDRDKDRERRKRKEKEGNDAEEETQHMNGDATEETVPPRGTSRGRPSPKASPARGEKSKETVPSKQSGSRISASSLKTANAKTERSTRGGQKETPARIPRPASAKGSRRRHRDGRRHGDSDDGEDEEAKEEKPKKREESTMNGSLAEDDLPPQVAASRRLARPSSARPAPPRVKKNEQEPQEVHIVGQSNVPNVIVDKDNDDSDEEEEDNFITKEDPLEVDEPPPPTINTEVDEEGGEHGGLVKKMLETKKELEGGSTIQQNKTPKKTEIERSQVTDATKRKEREMVQKEIDKLRSAIQLLTRSANPLGKIMDFVQEDMDSMQKEMATWSREHKENVVALQREQSITESSIEPLKAQLMELDSAISDQLDLIAAVKANIIRNDDKTEKMLNSITKS